MTNRLTPRQNLLAVLRHKTPEWVPCTPHIANMNNIPGQLPEELLRAPVDRLAVSRYVGGDVLYEVRASETKFGGSIEVRRAQEGDSIRETVETPLGCLTSRKKISRVKTPAYDPMPSGLLYPPDLEIHTETEFRVKALADYKIVRYMAEHTEYEFRPGRITEAMERVGEDGAVVINGPSTPLYQLISGTAGLERTVFDLFDDPGEVEETMAVMAEKNYAWYRQACKTEAEVIRCTEDLDTNLVSPELFKKYAVPVLKSYADICRQNGKVLVVHMCGHIKGFLPFLRDTGIDAIHCLCPPLTGNTPLRHAREILGKEVAVMARIDPPVLLQKTPAEITGEVKRMLAEVAPTDNFTIILPCGRAPMENLRAVVSAVGSFGKYPV